MIKIQFNDEISMPPPQESIPGFHSGVLVDKTTSSQVKKSILHYCKYALHLQFITIKGLDASQLYAICSEIKNCRQKCLLLFYKLDHTTFKIWIDKENV